MRVHERQHDGETDKTHECSICKLAFPRKNKLTEHLAKSHNIVLSNTNQS